MAEILGICGYCGGYHRKPDTDGGPADKKGRNVK